MTAEISYPILVTLAGSAALAIGFTAGWAVREREHRRNVARHRKRTSQVLHVLPSTDDLTLRAE